MSSNYSLNGIIDMHIHSAPDIRARSHNDFELANQALELGARAIVIKSHHVPTMDRAYLVQKIVPGVSVFGSLTLNLPVGGLNPYAVDTALQLGAKTVWLPTIDAANHRNYEGKSGGIEVLSGNKIVEPLKEIFKLIASHNAILATGHLSKYEIFRVVEEARKHGVQKIVVTHPEFNMIRLSLEEQRDLASNYGVYHERTYAQPIGGGRYKSNLPDNLTAIEALGPQSTIVSTDSGQIENPPWKDSIREYITYLHNHGITTDALDLMTNFNPARLLDLSEKEPRQ
ncbi:DUF6282 family protein [Paenibacillus glycanilyticus]|uniref:DUF6282 family protein n=1 Tax=Paenibacillus glycanilyticus TaxID=126569 RepID=UPI00190FE3FB|nr:DUF6282 family protein [Paenibacillus glycanilyticus]